MRLRLVETLKESMAFQGLISSYQRHLLEIAGASGPDYLGIKKALSIILQHEKAEELASIYFVEQELEKLLDSNPPTIDQDTLTEEFRQKADRLLQTFLFFDSKEKEEISKQLPILSLSSIKQFINLLHEGHHKQENYLKIMAEKDPHTAIKFDLIMSEKVSSQN